MDKKKKRGVRDSENTINIGLSVGQVCNLPTQGSWRPHSMQAQGKIWVFFLRIGPECSAGNHCERILNRSYGGSCLRDQISLYCLSLGIYRKVWAGVH
jgi:hypothetical protein